MRDRAPTTGEACRLRKGLINDPRLDDSYRINEGVVLARRLLIRLAELGVPAGCELLDVITPQYVADAVSWGAIGARTTESQVHRTSSGVGKMWLPAGRWCARRASPTHA